MALYRTAPTAARTDPTTISAGGLTRSIDVARLSQAAIDACGPAVLRSGPLPGLGTGTSWLAGHYFCGFDTWNHRPIGALVTIHDAAGTFNYRIDDRILLAQQGGFAYGIVSHNLMLQTCTKTGTSMTYADLVN